MTAKGPKIEGYNLAGVRGRYARQIIPLPTPPVQIGRDPDNQVVLTSPKLSRHHARIEQEGNRLFLTDLDSAHGTRVDGSPVVDKIALQHGCRIQLAEDEFLFVDSREEFSTQGYVLAEKETTTVGRLFFDRGKGPESFLLDEPTLSIGRDATNALVLDLPGVSGSHGKVRWVDETFTLVDLKSTNGTYLLEDGEKVRVDSIELKPGAVFFIGTCKLTFDIEKITRTKDAGNFSALPRRASQDAILPLVASILIVVTLSLGVLALVLPESVPDSRAPAVGER